MKVTPTDLPEVLILEPRVFGDARGFFMESYNERAFNAAVGYEVRFVQDNQSRSSRGVLRGLHYQLPPHPQGKLVRVTTGSVFDVAVDIRQSSHAIWGMGRRRVHRRKSASAMDSAGICARIPCAQPKRGPSLQDNRLLFALGGSCNPVERPDVADRLAPWRHLANPFRKRRCRAQYFGCSTFPVEAAS